LPWQRGMPVNNIPDDRSRRPKMVVFFGMTASGKSTLALAWSGQQGLPYYNTDRVRKELAGLQATDRRPDGIDQGIYSPALSVLTYQTMLERASADIAEGHLAVVLDGSYSKRSDRDAVRKAALTVGADCSFFYCSCSEEETRRRLEIRAVDREAVSDGRWEIFVHQRAHFECPQEDEQTDCVSLNTEDAVSALVKKITAYSCIQE